MPSPSSLSPAGETSTFPPDLRPRCSSRPLPRFQPGEIVAGRFRVTRFLGQGGMAQVFAAEDLELLGQAVALKVLRPDLPPDGPAARRFKSEALLARRVTHGNVCRLHDVFLHADAGCDETVLVMEMLEGETLAARLSRGPLSPAEALPLLRQICAGLDAAHRAGVAHLDLKSSNVVLVPADKGTRAVLTDFGLARGPSSPPAGPSWGTPAYMAPEQVEGGDVGPAADLYALGMMAHEMVTGRLPSEEGTACLPAAWEPAVRCCLEREPARRFLTALDFVAALEPPSPPSHLGDRVTPRLLLLGMVLLLAAAPSSQSLFEATARRAAAAGRWHQAVQLYQSRGESLYYEVRFAEAEKHLIQALSLSRRIGNRSREADALLWLARVDGKTGRLESARQNMEAAAHLFRQTGDRKREMNARRNLAGDLAHQGRLVESLPWLEDLLGLSRALGDREEEAATLLVLGMWTRYLRLDEGIRRLEEGLSLCEQTANPFCSPNATWQLGEARRDAGDLDAAEKLLHRSRDRFDQIGHPGGVARVAIPLARVELDRGRATQAAVLAESAARFFADRGRRAREAQALTRLAEALLAQGKNSDAARTLEQARALLQREATTIGAFEAIEVSLAQARLVGSLGPAAEGASLLRQAEGEARRLGLVSLAIEAAVARAALDGSNCADLPALETEARAGGFVRIAREAAASRASCQGRQSGRAS